MLQASRLAIIGLWALMQLFAPLVHAHAGGGQWFGTVHVPGLEFLAKSDAACAQADTGGGGPVDVIVGPAPGMKLSDGFAPPLADADFTVPPRFRWAAAAYRARKAPPPLPTASPPRQAWLKPSPRAPPA